MKKLLVLLAASMLHTLGFAQPIISNANNFPPVGYVDSVASLISPTTSPGNTGVNVTWNFSTLSPTVKGKSQIMQPSSTPYFANYPTANYVIQQTAFGGITTYEYWKIATSKVELLGSYISASTGTNFSPNPKLIISFPFTYNLTKTDTFQETGGAAKTYTMTYDGYGTLITPYATYHNVVRCKKDYGGLDYYFEWYSTSPYSTIVAKYENKTNEYYFSTKELPTAVENVVSVASGLSVYPNPAQSFVMLSLAENNFNKDALVALTDITGKLITQVALQGGKALINRGNIPAGIYIATVFSEGKNGAHATVVFE